MGSKTLFNAVFISPEHSYCSFLAVTCVHVDLFDCFNFIVRLFLTCVGGGDEIDFVIVNNFQSHISLIKR